MALKAFQVVLASYPLTNHTFLGLGSIPAKQSYLIASSFPVLGVFITIQECLIRILNGD